MPLSFQNGRESFRAPAGDTFSLVMAGDCCPWKTGLAAIRAGRSAAMVAAVKPFIDSADVKLMQWETPLAEEESPIDKSGPNLNCPPETIALLHALGIDVALLANNHTGDHGGAAVLETLHRLQAAGLQTVGAGATPDEANQPLLLRPNGIRLALINLAEHEFGTVTATTPGCAALSPLANIRAIREAAKNADVVVVVVHGGHERNPLPSPRMMDTYRAFIEAGAGAVINCHTHCPEGIELWHGAPIVYSPGNFFFPWKNLKADHLNALWWVGYLPKLHFDKRGVYALEVMPFRFDNDQLHALPEADNTAFYAYLAELNRLLGDDATVRRLFEAWAAKQGGVFLSWIRDRLAKWPIALDSREAVRELLPVRNVFTCESHNDMMTQYLRLIEEGRVSQALADWPAIQKLQSPDWAERHWQALRNPTP
jgi:hypothetical protein